MVARISQRLQVLPARQTDRAFAHGQGGNRTPAQWAAISRRLAVGAVIDGRITTGKQWRVRLVVRSGPGIPVGSLEWASGQPREMIQDVLREAPGRLLALVNRTHTARPAGRVLAARATPERRRVSTPGGAEGEPEQIEDSEEGSEEPANRRAGSASKPRGRQQRGPADASGRRRVPRRSPIAGGGGPVRVPHLLEASFGPRTIGRTLTFTDNVSGAPGYSLPMATAIGGELTLFPGARLGGVLSYLGLAAAWETSVAARTRGADGEQRHPTRYLAYRVGARGFVPLGQSSLRVGLDQGQQRFDLDLPQASMSPDVNYRFLRPSVEGRIHLDDFSVALGLSYLHVLAAGGLGDAGHFPRAKVRGVEGVARVAYAVASDLEVDLGAELRRFAFTMNVRQGDPFIAGGAVDDYLSAALRLTYRLR